MSGYIFPTETGTRAKYGPWDIGLWMANDSGVGCPFVLGYEDPGTGWVVVGVIGGAYDEATWVSVIAAAGGMGNYIVSKFPLINSLLAQYFDTKPNLPPETNATPYSSEAFNIALREYIAIQPEPGKTHPVIKLGYFP